MNHVQSTALFEEDGICPVQSRDPAHFPRKQPNPTKEWDEVFIQGSGQLLRLVQCFFQIDFKFEVTATGGNVAGDTQSVPINGMAVKSAGKNVYEATDLHKVIFIKNLLDFSGGHSRSVAKNQF